MENIVGYESFRLALGKYYNTMKSSSLLVMLLGFGFLAPLMCSKARQPKEKKEAQEQPAQKPVKQSQLALYGPVVKVVAAPVSKG